MSKCRFFTHPATRPEPAAKPVPERVPALYVGLSGPSNCRFFTHPSSK